MLIILLLIFAAIGSGVDRISSQSGTEIQEFSIFESIDRDDYILSAGDILQVVVEGGTSETMLVSGLAPIAACQVSSGGTIQLSGIGQLSVTGMFINEAEVALQQLVNHYYYHVQIGLTLLQPRTVKVWITGMVARPGRYTMYATSRVSDLVLSAGGMSSFSSRKGWLVTENGDSTYIDLHFDRETSQPVCDPFVTGGSSVSFQLITSPVYVIRPGVRSYSDSYAIPEVETWESKQNETIREFIYRIGGITGDVDLARSTLLGASESTPIWRENFGFSDSEINPGDTLRLVVHGNDVYVAGAVHQRGIVSYMPGADAGVYIERAGGTVYNGNTGGATITRDGALIASGDEALEMEILPGDIIEVPYGWVASNSYKIGLFATVVGITSVIINLAR